MTLAQRIYAQWIACQSIASQPSRYVSDAKRPSRLEGYPTNQTRSQEQGTQRTATGAAYQGLAVRGTGLPLPNPLPRALRALKPTQSGLSLPELLAVLTLLMLTHLYFGL